MPEEFRDSLDAGAGDTIDGAVDIGSIASIAPEPERKPGKRRGRPPGSGAGTSGAGKGTGKEKTRAALDLSSLTGLFVGIHVIASGATNVPELVIDQSEGDAFMKSAQQVMRHYSVESSQKTIDCLTFGGTCCMIYGTRFGAYMLRKREEAKAETPRTIYAAPMSPRPTTAPQESQHFEVVPEFGNDDGG